MGIPIYLKLLFNRKYVLIAVQHFKNGFILFLIKMNKTNVKWMSEQTTYFLPDCKLRTEDENDDTNLLYSSTVGDNLRMQSENVERQEKDPKITQFPSVVFVNMNFPITFSFHSALCIHGQTFSESGNCILRLNQDEKMRFWMKWKWIRENEGNGQKYSRGCFCINTDCIHSSFHTILFGLVWYATEKISHICISSLERELAAV